VSKTQRAIEDAESLMVNLRAACSRMSDRNGTDELRAWRSKSEADRLDRLEHPDIDPTASILRGRALLRELGLE